MSEARSFQLLQQTINITEIGLGKLADPGSRNGEGRLGEYLLKAGGASDNLRGLWLEGMHA
jgi:hypothetical protein